MVGNTGNLEVVNIFYLDKEPFQAAKYHCDKHVVKMILESAQLLSGAHWLLGTFDENKSQIYQPTHINHPSAIWTRKSHHHYDWLYNLYINLLKEYTKRYGKIHACERLVEPLRKLPFNINYNLNFIPPPQCMPDECKNENDTVQAYRNYYNKYKLHFAKWKNTEKPFWVMNGK